MNTPPTQDRRGFLKAWGRGTVLAILGAAGLRATRGKPLDPEAHRCISKSICCRCPRETACPLPAAVSARRSAPPLKPEESR